MSPTSSKETKIVYSPSTLATEPKVRDYWQQFGEVRTTVEQDRLVVYIRYEDKSIPQ
jgi:hypothetical protein